jgi:hypothetical protein
MIACESRLITVAVGADLGTDAASDNGTGPRSDCTPVGRDSCEFGSILARTCARRPILLHTLLKRAGQAWVVDVLRAMQYYILSSPGRPDEVARWRDRSAASYYEPESQKWIADPLLAVEILAGDDWRPVEVADLPPGIPDVEPAGRHRSRAGSRSSGRRSSRSGILGFRRAR